MGNSVRSLQIYDYSMDYDQNLLHLKWMIRMISYHPNHIALLIQYHFDLLSKNIIGFERVLLLNIFYFIHVYLLISFFFPYFIFNFEIASNFAQIFVFDI